MELTEEQRKANKKAYNKKWRDNNKEKKKEYNEEHKEQIKEYDKKYREGHKEQKKAYDKEYRQTPKGKRINRIKCLKHRGMIEPDGGWDKFIDMVENTTNCEICNVELTTDKVTTKTTRCIDHSHITGLFRNVVCQSCNLKLPRGT